jgi:Sec-independent protein translocase protein TatA
VEEHTHSPQQHTPSSAPHDLITMTSRTPPAPAPAPQPPRPATNDHTVAQLVLRYVDDVRDRLMLECVSNAWRLAGCGAPAAWSPRATLELNPLPLARSKKPAPLVAKLTDARLLSVLRRAGPDLRSLVVNGAGKRFTGRALVDFVGSFLKNAEEAEQQQTKEDEEEEDEEKKSSRGSLSGPPPPPPLAAGAAFRQLQRLGLSR